MSYKQQLLDALRNQKPVVTKVENVPVLGTVYLRKLTVAEIAKQAEAQSNDEDKESAIVKGIAGLLCDENGNRVFDINNAEEMKLLASIEWDALDVVREAIGKSKNPKA